MPAKKTLPRNAKRLPKGTTKDDYEPEVIEAWQRDRWRQQKAKVRAKLRHRGLREVTFFLSKDARANLKHACKKLGVSKTELLTHLLEQFHV